MPISREQAIEALARLDRETDARLREAQKAVEEAARVYEQAKQVRAAVIEEAIAGNWSMGRVGKSLGMSRQRVSQLRHEAEHGGSRAGKKPAGRPRRQGNANGRESHAAK
jgi:hypothetical protein